MPTELTRPHTSIGTILIKFGVITPEQLKEALAQCDPEQRSLGPVLISLGFATEEKISKAVSLHLGIPFFTTFEGLLDPEAARGIPEATARKLLVVPVFQDKEKLTLGMVNPTDFKALDQIAGLKGVQVQPVMTSLANLFTAIQEVYMPGKTTARDAGAPGETSRPAAAAVGSVVDALNDLLEEGMARLASDIHLEAAETQMRARFRVDGMLQDAKTFPKDIEAALVARVKILAKLDITETRLPQDGHLRFVYGGRGVDVRVATLPTVHGEKVVMRLLDSTKSLRKLKDLGIDAGILARFSEAIASPNGLILVTGPTGSGKTTTLYSALSELNKTDRNIVTLEDPVEYVMDRVNQMEAFAKIGLTFASGLRAILRQDPNIILVGEIRDLETAEIALQASITGHMVFSTLHTNDAVSCIHRLLNMRVEPFMIAAALRGVLAQRLLRRLCDKCKRPLQLSGKQLTELGLPAIAGACFEPVGCRACFNTGYAGRIAIHEWMPVTRAVRELIMRKASVDELRAAVDSEGFKSIRRTAIDKAMAGETSLEEVLRMAREQTEA